MKLGEWVVTALSRGNPRPKPSRMNLLRVAMLCAIAQLIVGIGTARAQEEQPWWRWSTIDGNWGGYRERLADYGLVFSGSSVNDLQGNVSGGSHRDYAVADSSVFALDADLGALANIRGLFFHAEFVGVLGQNLSTKSLDNVLQVATAYAQRGSYLGQMYLTQKLFDGRFTLEAGRVTTANNFASLPVFNDYVSYAINPVPISVENNTTFFTSLPSVEWAAVATIKPSEDLSFAAGVYNTNLPSGLPFGSRHGVDFSFGGSGGPMEVAQLSYNLNGDPGAAGLPGIYYLGGFYSGADYTPVAGGGNRKGDYGFYFQVQQMVYREGGPGSDVGLTPWISVTYTPPQSINQLPVFVSGGAVYHGLIRGRSDDTTGLAYYYGKFSNELPAFTGEKVLELDYNWWATPWLTITPDLQYVFNPSGRSSSRNALVPGTQVTVLF